MGTYSNTINLQNAVIEKLIARHPEASVVTRDLSKQRYPHLAEANIAAFFAPGQTDTPEYKEAIRNSDEAISEVENADIIVIGAPMYNFSVPSALKAWIDHIIRIGKTFYYDETGMPQPMISGKKVYVAMSSGGIYSDGPMKTFDFVDPYLRAVLGFIGLTDIKTFRVEGISIPGMKETALQTAIENVAV